MDNYSVSLLSDSSYMLSSMDEPPSSDAEKGQMLSEICPNVEGKVTKTFASER